MKLFHAFLETAHYTFDAYASSALRAARLIEKGWNLHQEEVGADYGPGKLKIEKGLWGIYYSVKCDDIELDFSVIEVRTGAVYRDHEELKKKRSRK